MTGNIITFPSKKDSASAREQPKYQRQFLLNRYLPHLDVPTNWKLDPDEFEATHEIETAIDISLKICRYLRLQHRAYARKSGGSHHVQGTEKAIFLVLAKENRFLLHLIEKAVKEAVAETGDTVAGIKGISGDICAALLSEVRRP